jgi:adenosylmethionine-8-amino-7-oxononanoate aminotransferase
MFLVTFGYQYGHKMLLVDTLSIFRMNFQPKNTCRWKRENEFASRRAAELEALILAEGADTGLIVRAVAGSSIAMCPPLIITETQIDEMIEKLSAALDQTLDYVRADNLLVA